MSSRLAHYIHGFTRDTEFNDGFAVKSDAVVGLVGEESVGVGLDHTAQNERGSSGDDSYLNTSCPT